jgi:hypothetical protein
MKKGIFIDDDLHDFDKESLVTEPGGFDWWKCKKCGLRGKRYGLGSSIIHVTDKKSLIENCTGEPKKQNKKEVIMPDEGNEMDVLEKAAEIVQAAAETTDNPLMKKNVRDEFWEDVGIVEGLELAESLIEYSKLMKFHKFSQNKRYKTELGVKNFTTFCKQFGLSLSSGKKLREQLKALGVKGYKALSNAKLKQSDLNFLTTIDNEFEIKQTENGYKIEIDGVEEELTPENKDKIQAIIARLQLEKAETKKEAETARKEADELDKKYQEIKGQLLEETKPGKEVETTQKVCQAYQDDFLKVITGLRKLYEKNPTNGQILEIIVGTVFYIDNLNASLKTMLNMTFDTDTAGNIMTPEDIIQKLGDEKEN